MHNNKGPKLWLWIYEINPIEDVSQRGPEIPINQREIKQ